MSATEANDWTIAAQPTRGRACGKCQACCTMVPVELAPGHTKPSGQRCGYQCSRGCSIYPTRPDPCRYWSCRWLFDPDTADLRRPDQSGIVIDAVTDHVLIDGKPFEVVQVWIDPARPEAHRDPALRAYLRRIAERYGYGAIIRWKFPRAMLLVHDNGEWIEREQMQASREKVNAALEASGVTPMIR